MVVILMEGKPKKQMVFCKLGACPFEGQLTCCRECAQRGGCQSVCRPQTQEPGRGCIWMGEDK